jgi:threonine dehydratase
LAYAGNLLGVQATIFLPETAPAEKRQAMRAYGATIIDAGKTMGEALDQAYLFAQKTHSLLIHPFADPLVIAGQGTIALEMLEDISHLDALVVAVGGGGMISGVSLVAKHLRPTLHIYGVEPVGCPTLYTSLKEGKITPMAAIQTRAGTLAVRETAPLNFGIVCQNVDRITLVSDDEMHRASEWLWAHYAIPTELSGAAAFAALLFNKIDFPPEVKAVGCILCGTGHEGLEGHV